MYFCAEYKILYKWELKDPLSRRISTKKYLILKKFDQYCVFFQDLLLYLLQLVQALTYEAIINNNTDNSGGVSSTTTDQASTKENSEEEEGDETRNNERNQEDLIGIITLRNYYSSQ